jgi:N-acylneuraminate cytidylyltransferase
LCVVTARAGSQGVPLKNVRKLLDEPLFIWSVKASEQSKYIDVTAVSSNCSEVKKCYEEAIRRGSISEHVIWVQRPDVYATPTSKNEEALIHALSIFELLSKKFDVIVNLQPTSPCRTGDLLDKCIEKYQNGGYDSLLTANKDTPFLWQKKNGKWTYIIDKNDCCNRKMRQEFRDDEDNSEFVLHDCGSVYLVNSEILLETGCRIGKHPCIFEISGLNSLQIDEEFDFTLIENMAKSLNIYSLV